VDTVAQKQIPFDFAQGRLSCRAARARVGMTKLWEKKTAGVELRRLFFLRREFVNAQSVGAMKLDDPLTISAND
jgi:hypothetical protein